MCINNSLDAIIFNGKDEKDDSMSFFDRWERIFFEMRGPNQPYRLFLEVAAPHENSSVAIDNVRLINCFPGS